MRLYESLKSSKDNSDHHINVLTKELEKISKKHTDMLPEKKEALRPYIFNSCVNVSYAGKRGQQIDNVKEPMEKKT